MNELPRQKLCELIAEHGASLCDEPLRCEELLRDLCPNNPGEVNLLVDALRGGVATQLRSRSPVPIELRLSRLTKLLEQHKLLSQETARWAVESWALALGSAQPYRTGDRREIYPSAEPKKHWPMVVVGVVVLVGAAAAAGWWFGVLPGFRFSPAPPKAPNVRIEGPPGTELGYVVSYVDGGRDPELTIRDIKIPESGVYAEHLEGGHRGVLVQVKLRREGTVTVILLDGTREIQRATAQALGINVTADQWLAQVKAGTVYITMYKLPGTTLFVLASLIVGVIVSFIYENRTLPLVILVLGIGVVVAASKEMLGIYYLAALGVLAAIIWIANLRDMT